MFLSSIIVDMENEFCSPGGKLYNETSARIMPGVISAIQGITERARAAAIPIIYIHSMRTLQEPEFAIFGTEPKLERDTWSAEIVEKLEPHEGDIIVPKFSHDPFYKTDLDKVLDTLVADPTRYYAIITGGAINVCLYHAVMGFHVRNYLTVVPVDCVFYMSNSGRRIALEQFSNTYPYPMNYDE